ncbi:MAG: response regulator [Polyangiales bacterium]
MKLLVVEDNELDAELVLRELTRGGFTVSFERVDTPEALSAALDRGGWDLIISDYSMPRFSAPAALALVKQKGVDLPFIIVSGTVGEEIAVEAIRAGAHDFMTKGAFARLIPAVERELRDAAMRAERGRMQNQLRIADRLASVGTLAAGIAHDFNNILGAILSFATFVQEKLEDSDQRRSDIDEVLSNTQRGVALTRQLLTFCQQQPSAKRAVDLNDSLTQLHKLLVRTIGSNITLTVELPAKKVVVQIDPVQFDQIVLNLAVNARDAMPDGGNLHIKLSSLDRPGPAGRVKRLGVLTVRDTGSGMSESVSQRIFEPFFTTKQPGKGTGLGLATCFGIVQDADGAIRVDSAEGKGTTFTIELPLSAERVEEATVDRSSVREGRGEQILVVEDDQALRRSAVRVLQGAGYRVHAAADGDEGVRRIDELGSGLDVVVTDVVMPGRSGYEVLEHLSRVRPDAVAVLTSGHSGDNVPRSKPLELPILWKPWSPRALVRAVGEALAVKDPAKSQRPSSSVQHAQGELVLVVEDDEATQKALTRMLAAGGYSTASATTLSAARQALERGPEPRLMLCDLSLPDGSATELLDFIRIKFPALCPRVFVLTGGIVDAAGCRLVDSGAFRILHKPIEPKRLLEHLAGVRSSWHPPGQEPAKTRGHSSRPPPPMRERSKPSGGRVLLVDDDEVLAQVSSRVLSEAGFDVVVATTLATARHVLSQGDLDALVSDVGLPDGSGLDLLRQLRGASSELPVVMMTGAPSVESAAIAIRGRVREYLSKPIPPDELVRAVRSAIEGGKITRLRNKLLAARCGGDEFVRDVPGTEQSFARALQKIRVVYQPIVRSVDDSVYGFEALLRCDEPTLASPLRLLAAAEVLGRVVELGQAVRASVAATMIEHHDRVEAIFVNLHPSELRADVLVRSVDPLLPLARRVVLEVTERASIEGGAKLDDELFRIRELGYRIAVDDLGEGYAGLTSLVTLRPDIAKIDMSLVRDIERSPLKQDIVAALVDMARRAEIIVVAEGVETLAERDVLAQLGCDLLQGYFYAKPGPPFPVPRTATSA